MAVSVTMAVSEPGIFFTNRVENAIMRMLTTPKRNGSHCASPMERRYKSHLGTKSAGMFVRPRPKRSFIWVEKMVTAIPAVKPTTMG